MNIARAAKGAAYLLMVFGLVALVACQAGPAGPTGATGAKGEPGVAGKPGAPGTAALAAVGGSTTAYHILINNKGTVADPTEGDLKKPSTSADVTELFIGGVQPVTYTLTQEDAATDHFTAKLNDDNVIEVGKRTGSTADLTAATTYTTGGTDITVQATDANGVVATKAVTIKHNRAPVAGQSETHARLKLVVGTQPEEHKTALTPSVTYKAMNKIHNLDISGTHAAGSAPAYQPYWGAGGTADAQFAATIAEDGRTVTFEITKIERGTDDAKKGSEHVMAELSGARNHLLSITGLKSTWDTSLDPDNHLPVNVEITATDTGGMSTKITFAVTVDGAPQAGATAPAATFFTKATGVQTAVVRNLRDFYTDPEGVTSSIVGVSIDPSTAGVVAMAGNHLMLTPNNQGKATITYYALSDGRPAAGGISALSGTSLDRDGDGSFETAALEVITNQVIKGTIEVTITP